MFLRFKRAKGYVYALVVENYRSGGSTRQRTIRNVGRADKLDPAYIVQELAKMPGFVFLRGP